MKVLIFLALFAYCIYGYPTNLNHHYPELESGYFEGDIVLNGLDPRNGLLDKDKRWPNGKIPYEILDGFTEEELAILKKAMAEYEKKTCIRFIPKEEDTEDYVRIQNKYAGCFSTPGKRGGRQMLNFGKTSECFARYGTIIHEMMHLVGFFHEQSRTDRDDYVKIVWENIDEANERQFEKLNDTTVTGFGVSYDYNSVMHYPRWAFTNNGDDTIIPTKDPNAEIGQREGFSVKDLQKINKMYNCKM